MKIVKLTLITVLVCLCVFACSAKDDEWMPIETVDQVNGIWEGSDVVLLPKSKFTLSTNTSARVSIAILCDEENSNVVYAVKYDFSKFLGAATKDIRFKGKTKQEIWNLFTENSKNNEAVLIDKFTVTIRSITDLGSFASEWEPVITEDDKKMRILFDVSYILGAGQGVYFTLRKVESSKILSAYGVGIGNATPFGPPEVPQDYIMPEYPFEESPPP